MKKSLVLSVLCLVLGHNILFAAQRPYKTKDAALEGNFDYYDSQFNRLNSPIPTPQMQTIIQQQIQQNLGETDAKQIKTSEFQHRGSQNVQDSLDELETEKFNRAGDNLTNNNVYGGATFNSYVKVSSFVQVGVTASTAPISISVVTDYADPNILLQAFETGTPTINMLQVNNSSGTNSPKVAFTLEKSAGKLFEIIGKTESNPEDTKLAIDLSNGNIGIGTTAPSTLLDIADNIHATSAGKLGLGISTPTFTLDVGGYGSPDTIGSGSLIYPFAISGNTDGTMNMEICNANAGTNADSRFSVVDNAHETYLSFAMPSRGNTNSLFGTQRSSASYIFNATLAGTDPRHFIIGNVANRDLRFGTNNLERMVIKNDGVVGVGTSAPAHNLSVVGNMNISTSLTVGTSQYIGSTLGVNGKTTMLDTLTVKSSLTVTGDAYFADEITAAATGYIKNVIFTDDRGNGNRDLGRMATTLEEMKSNTLLDKSHSGLSCSGGVLTYTLYADNGEGRWNFDDIDYSIAVTSASIALTGGTNTVPKTNYIYFDKSGDAIAMYASESVPTSTTVIHVGIFVVGEVGISTYTIFAYDRHKEEVHKFVNRTIHRIAEVGSYYHSGFAPTVTSTAIAINSYSATPSEFFNGIFPMEVSQTKRMEDGFVYISSAGHYKYCTALSQLNVFADSNDTAAVNERMNVVWGIVPSSLTIGGTVDADVKLFAVIPNKPSSAYISDSLAINDISETLNIYPPDDNIRRVFVPVARTIVFPSNNTLQVFPAGTYYQDLRGKVTSCGGGATPTVDLSSYAKLESTQTFTGENTFQAGNTRFHGTNATPASVVIPLSGADSKINFTESYTTNSGWSLGIRADDNAFMISNSSNSLGTNRRIIINSTGNVGISTGSPVALLDINGTLQVAGTSTFKSSVTVNSPLQIFPTISDNFSLLVTSQNGGVRLAVAKSGNIGIGSTAPAYNLDILNTVGYAQQRIQSTASGSELYLDRLNKSADAVVRFSTSTTTQWVIGMDNQPTANADDFAFKIAANENAKILFQRGTGYVGIGVTAPTYQLQTSSSIYCGKVMYADDYVTYTEPIPSSGLFAILGAKNDDKGKFDHNSFPGKYTVKVNEEIPDGFEVIDGTEVAKTKTVEITKDGTSLNTQIMYLMRAVQELYQQVQELKK